LPYENLTAGEWLVFQARAYAVPEPEVHASAYRIASELGVENFLDRRIKEVSAGNRQKILIAGGFFSGGAGPKVLVLDEPTSWMDPPARQSLAELLRDWVTKAERAVLVSSHNLPELSSLADTVLMLSGGTVVAGGLIHEMVARSKAKVICELTLFDTNADELADALGSHLGLEVWTRGQHAVLFHCDDEDHGVTIQRILKLLAVNASRFRLRELKEQQTPLERLYDERILGAEG
jgi:ABC-2 type transport system ATP-binding protein